MRSAYRILADVIAVAVVIQSMAMVWAIAGLFHGIVGGMVIPVIALALLIIAFFARVPGGVKWAAILVVLVIVQLVAGYGGYDAAWLGLIHGLNAFALFSLAIVAARAAHPVAETDAQTAMTATP
jgi:hypothetical protein